MADEQTSDQNPVFQIQRVYLKDLSLERPNSPQFLLEQQQPQVDIQLGVGGGPPTQDRVFYRDLRTKLLIVFGTTENFAEGEGAAWCVAFTDDGNVMRESYVNLIPTPAGGTHESGLKDGLFGAIKGFIELHALAPKGVKLMPEDVFSRASFVLSAKVLDPQFQGQTKERLNSRDAVRLVSTYVKPGLELWLNQHVDYGKKLAELAIKAAQTRQKAGQKVEKRKGSGVAVLPGKLTDCDAGSPSPSHATLRSSTVPPPSRQASARDSGTRPGGSGGAFIV